MKWKDYVREALVNLGRQGRLKEIYPLVEKVREERGDTTGKLEEWVRNALQQNSRGKGSNIFEPVYPVESRRGIWRLK
ncbi:MAG: RuvA C-terminal domain-containing protein [Nanoarchaeota archaeon]|nr:RuvA C-terminal domain-containing protein [Nanoarchaeota archaeon]